MSSKRTKVLNDPQAGEIWQFRSSGGGIDLWFIDEIKGSTVKIRPVVNPVNAGQAKVYLPGFITNQRWEAYYRRQFMDIICNDRKRKKYLPDMAIPENTGEIWHYKGAGGEGTFRITGFTEHKGIRSVSMQEVNDRSPTMEYPLGLFSMENWKRVDNFGDALNSEDEPGTIEI